MANSGAICARPSTWADMVRPGAILYGYYQSFDPPQKGQEVRAAADRAEPFDARANHHVCAICRSEQGVGYSARFVTDRPSRIAVINAGYADGIVRQRTNHGCAIVRGHRVPLVGTISMDLTHAGRHRRSGCPRSAISLRFTAKMGNRKSSYRTWPARSAPSLRISSARSAGACPAITSDCVYF